MKRFITLFLLLISLFFIAACSEDADRSFSIDDVTIDAQIDEEGIIHVRELYTYTFNGSYEGMTRSIESDVQNFEAYVTEDTDPTISTDNLKPLTVEEEDNTLKIFSKSTDETKNVLYSYTVEGSVEKYTDVADLKYSFFDESNETDLHNVEISIHTPANTINDNTHYFLHEDETGNLRIENNSLHYTNSVLKVGQSSLIRFVFPSEQLSGMDVTKEEVMESEILAAERDLAERRESLGANMNKVMPVIWILLAGTVIVAIFLLIIHPNRYRGDKSEDALLRLLENTDPLFVKYMNNGYLPNDSFIAALFSLKQRGIVTLKEVPSHSKEGENTFRFTWVTEAATVDMADNYLYSWLFSEKDDLGAYFLLESLLDNENESDEVKKEKAEQFQNSFGTWSELVKGRDSYKGLKKDYKRFSFFSIPLILATFGVYYYFTTIDTISQTEQWVLPLIVAVLSSVALFFNRNKWVLSSYYSVVIIMTLIGFSKISTVILATIFFFIAWIALVIVPSYYWNQEIRKLKFAIRKAYQLFKTGNYPVGSKLDKIERRLEYAIILGVGKDYGEQYGKEELVTQLKTTYPLLNNPIYTTTTFSVSNLVLYTVAVQSSTSNTTTSSTGGGGAGAF